MSGIDTKAKHLHYSDKDLHAKIIACQSLAKIQQSAIQELVKLIVQAKPWVIEYGHIVTREEREELGIYKWVDEIEGIEAYEKEN